MRRSSPAARKWRSASPRAAPTRRLRRAANLMGLTSEEADAYCKAVVQADFEEAGDEDVIRKLLGDLVSAQVDMDEAKIRSALGDATVEARRQLLEAQ